MARTLSRVEQLNRLAENPGRTPTSLKDLTIDALYKVQKLKKARTIYGVKVAACLQPDLYVYLTPRVSQDLLTNKKAGLRDLQELINDESLYLQLKRGPYHPIKWVIQQKKDSSDDDSDSDSDEAVEQRMNLEDEEEEDMVLQKRMLKGKKGKRSFNVDADDADDEEEEKEVKVSTISKKVKDKKKTPRGLKKKSK